MITVDPAVGRNEMVVTRMCLMKNVVHVLLEDYVQYI